VEFNDTTAHRQPNAGASIFLLSMQPLESFKCAIEILGSIPIPLSDTKPSKKDKARAC
jgi:hypothetical protein